MLRFYHNSRLGKRNRKADFTTVSCLACSLWGAMTTCFCRWVSKESKASVQWMGADGFGWLRTLGRGEFYMWGGLLQQIPLGLWKSSRSCPCRDNVAPRPRDDRGNQLLSLQLCFLPPIQFIALQRKLRIANIFDCVLYGQHYFKRLKLLLYYFSERSYDIIIIIPSLQREDWITNNSYQYQLKPTIKTIYSRLPKLLIPPQPLVPKYHLVSSRISVFRAFSSTVPRSQSDLC